MGFVPVDRHPLRSLAHKNIFTIGDAIDVPTSEAGAVAHFEADIFVENFLAAVNGEPFPHRFDGHANCFVELGRGEALLLDFNYDTQLLTGKFPLPGIGPMKLLGASRLNHLGKLAFEKIYWNVLLPGHALPVPTALSMAGKHLPRGAQLMPVNSIEGHTFNVNDEGFFTDPAEWNEDLACILAELIGIEQMTEAHWKALRFMREDAARNGTTPTLRRMQTVGGFDVKELFRLFPGEPAKKMAYLAGLPRPVGCV